MGELQEIVDLAAVERLFRLLAIIGPLIGLAVGAVMGRRSGHLRQGTLAGLLIGLLGTLNWLMWRIYNAITESNGLDTVKNLLLNVGLFAAAGVILGLASSAWRRKASDVSRREDAVLEAKN